MKNSVGESSMLLRSQRRGLKTLKSLTKKAAIGAALRCSFCCRSFHNYDAFVFVKIIEHYFYDLALFRRHQLADVISLDRQFPMFVAAINQDRQLHTPRPAKIDQLVERSPHRAPGVKNVINQNDAAAFTIAGQSSATDNRLGPHRPTILTTQTQVG